MGSNHIKNSEHKNTHHVPELWAFPAHESVGALSHAYDPLLLNGDIHHSVFVIGTIYFLCRRFPAHVEGGWVVSKMQDSYEAVTLNAWQFPASIRHQVIFSLLDVLPMHHTLLLINDHDPKPLFYQIDAEQPGVFSRTPPSEKNSLFYVSVTRVLPKSQ